MREVTYEGDVVLRGNSELDTYTQVFWSENAGNTVSIFSVVHLPFVQAQSLICFIMLTYYPRVYSQVA